MPIRNDYGSLLLCWIHERLCSTRVDWNKRSADSLFSLRVISAGRMMNKLRPGRHVESSSNAVALLTILLHSTFPYCCRLTPKWQEPLSSSRRFQVSPPLRTGRYRGDDSRMESDRVDDLSASLKINLSNR
jgi:hypothetical protein